MCSYADILAYGFGMIIGLGSDFWVCLCWVGVLFFGFCFFLWIFRECIGGMLLVLVACSTGVFMRTLAGVGGKGRSGREGLVFRQEWPVALCFSKVC